MAEFPSVCEHLHLPLQSGSDRVLAAMHRGYTARALPRQLAAASGAVPTWRSRPISSSGFPGETDDDFERTLEVAVAAAAYDSAYTFIFSPATGTEASTCPIGSWLPTSWPTGSSGCGSSSSGRLAKHTARIGRRRGVVVEGPAQRTRRHHGPTRQNKLVHSFGRAARGRGTVRHGREVERAAPHHLTGHLLEVAAGLPRHRTRIPVATAVGVPPCRSRRRAIAVVGPTADRKVGGLPSPWRDASGRRPSSCRPTPSRSIEGWTSARRSRRPARRPFPITSSTWPCQSEEYSLGGTCETAGDAVADIEARGQATDPRRWHRPLRPWGVVDDLSCPASGPKSGRSSTPMNRSRWAPSPGWPELDPVSGRPDGAHQPPAHRSSPSRCAFGSGRAFSSFGPGLSVYPPTRFRQLAIDLPLATRRPHRPAPQADAGGRAGGRGVGAGR